MKKFKTLIILGLILILCNLGMTEEKCYNVIVFPIRTVLIDKELGDIITSLVTFELSKSTLLRIVEKKEIEKVLEQQALSLSGFCDELNCQIEVGKILNAKRIITGEIGKVGERFLIALKVISVETGETEFVVSDECIGGEDCIRELVLEAAVKIRIFLETGDKIIEDTVYSKYQKYLEYKDIVKVKEGYFIMGYSGRDRSRGEGPQRKVYLNAFYIDKYEVTNYEYRKCVEAKVCEVPEDRRFFDKKEFSHHPVVYVNWYQADKYCKWKGKRLPTEAEWEKVARGEEGRVYPYGNEWNSKACNWDGRWKKENKKDDVAPVGSYKEDVSIYGVFDLCGNVSEWVQDNYDENYHTISTNINPVIIKGKTEHSPQNVIKGASYDEIYQSRLRASFRTWKWSSRGYSYVGFRCVKDCEKKEDERSQTPD